MRLEFLCQTCGVIVEADSELGGDLVDCPECGATIMVPMDVVGSGMIVGGYKVLSKLGTGGMGDVYLAEHATMQRRVALKVLPPAMTRDRNAAERFLQEVRNQAALNHPNIATAYDAGRDREIFYLAMEYVEGVDIQRILSKKSIMPERESLRVALEVARGLDYAWYRKKIIHRDVKPANIMISKDADVQLLDMGLSRSMGDMDLSDTNFIIGTPLYMSPEQTDPDAQLDFRSDMYSLGSTLYHMLCGKTPYEGKTVAQILAARALREPVHIREVNPAISETCAAVVHTMLARDPAQRFSDWATAIAGITQALSGHQNASTSLITGIPDQPAADQQPVKKELPRVVPTMHAPTEQKPNPMIQVYLVALGVVALALITGLVALLKLPPRVNEADTQVASHAPVTPSVAPTNTIASLPSANPTPQTPAPAKTNELAEAQAAEQQRAVLALERMARETEAAQNDIRAEYTERLAAMRQRPEDHAGHVSALQALAPRAGSLELASLEQEIQDAIAGLKNERSQALDAIRVEIQQAIDSSLEKADYPAALQAVTAYSGPLQQETTDLRKDLEMQTNTRIERLQTEVREREQRAAEGYATLVDHLASFIISNQASQVKTHLEAAIKAPELEPVKAKLEELDSTLDLLNGLDEKILLTFKSQVGQTIEIETPDGPVLFVIKQVGTNSITVTRQVEDNGPIVGSIEMKLNPRDLSGAERVKRIEESFGSDADFVLGCLALRAQREQTALSYFKNSERDLSTALASRLVPIIKIKEAAVRKAAGEQVEREARWAFSSLLHSAMLPSEILAPDVLVMHLERSHYDESRVRVIRLMSSTYREKYGSTDFADTYRSFLDRLSSMRYYPVLSIEEIKRDIRAKNPGYNGEGVFEMEHEHITRVDLLEAGDIQDISALKSLPLSYLRLHGPNLRDLSPLKGLPLRTLILTDTGVEDLSPLADSPIENLSLKGTTQVRNLDTLAHMPLKKLSLAGTKFKQLDALKQLDQLEALDLLDTPADNLDFVAHLPLKVLKFQPAQIKKGMESLRANKTLEQIMLDDSGKALSVEAFWQLQDEALNTATESTEAGDEEPAN